MNFQPIYEKCKNVGITWETCNEKYCCDEGEDCWFASEEYYKEELMK